MDRVLVVGVRKVQGCKRLYKGPLKSRRAYGEDIKNSKNYLEFVDEANDMLMKILAKHTGQSLEKIREDCAREYWMDAKTAQAYGIVDHII